MDAISSYFIFIPGAIIFLVGSAQVRQWLSERRRAVFATVKKCNHVVKKDKKGRDSFNYYDVSAETDSGEILSAKSPSEYAEGQRVRILRSLGNAKAGDAMISEKRETVFHPIALALLGALLLLLAMEERRGNEKAAMAYLAAIMIGAGASLVASFVRLKQKNLLEIKAQIIDIYSRQISKESKIVKSEKFTYYPVVKFELDGKKNIRRLAVNSSRKDSFKVGSEIPLYYDSREKSVLEHRAEPFSLAAGIVLLALGILAASSLAAVILQTQA